MLQIGSAGRRCCLLSLLPHAWSRLWRMPAQLGQHRSTGHLSVLPPCSCSPSPVSQWLPASVHPRQQPEKDLLRCLPRMVNSPRGAQTAPLQGTGFGCFAPSERHHPQCSPRPSAPDSPAHDGQHLEEAASSGHSYRKGTRHPLPGTWDCSSGEMAPSKGFYTDLIT